MILCVWGEGYLSQVKQNPNIWISVKIACLRTRIFSQSQTETFSFIHVSMKLKKGKRQYKPVPEAQSVASPFKSRGR